MILRPDRVVQRWSRGANWSKLLGSASVGRAVIHLRTCSFAERSKPSADISRQHAGSWFSDETFFAMDRLGGIGCNAPRDWRKLSIAERCVLITLCPAISETF